MGAAAFARHPRRSLSTPGDSELRVGLLVADGPDPRGSADGVSAELPRGAAAARLLCAGNS